MDKGLPFSLLSREVQTQFFLKRKFTFQSTSVQTQNQQCLHKEMKLHCTLCGSLRFSITQVVRNACASAGIETVDGHQPDQVFQW